MLKMCQLSLSLDYSTKHFLSEIDMWRKSWSQLTDLFFTSYFSPHYQSHCLLAELSPLFIQYFRVYEAEVKFLVLKAQGLLI